MKGKSLSYWAGCGAVIFSAVFYSAKTVFVKLCYLQGAHPLAILTLRMLLSSPFFLLVLACSLQSKRTILGKAYAISKQEHLFVWIAGFVGFYLASLLDFYGLQYISAGLERIVIFTYPTFVILFSAFLSRRRIPSAQIYALGITYTGLVLSFAAEIGGAQKNVWLGILFVFGSAIAFALYYLMSARLVHVLGSLFYTSYALLVSTAAIFLHFLCVSPISELAQSGRILNLCLCMAFLSTVIPTLLLSLGIRRVGSGTASILSTLGPISTVALAALFLDESISTLQMLGGGFVIFGVLLAGLATSQEVVSST